MEQEPGGAAAGGEPSRHSLEAALRARFAAEGDVVAAYVRAPAGGPPDPRAAVDVGVLLSRCRDPATREQELRTLVAEVIEPAEPNLVLLNQASPGTAYRVVADGRLVISRDETARLRHELAAIEAYFDMAELRRMLATGLRHQVGGGGLGDR